MISTQRQPFGLSRALRARMLPLTLIAAAVVTFSAPLAFITLRITELRLQGHTTALQVADLIRREIDARPHLWQYDTLKLLQHIRSLTAQGDVRAVVIVDSDGKPLDLGDRPSALHLDPPLIIWQSAPIALGNATRGHVWVALSTERAFGDAGALLAIFATVAAVMGFLQSWIPLRTVTLAKQNIVSLVEQLQHSQTELAHLNISLEAQVADRSAALQALAQRRLGINDEERRAIARELHDGAGQTLTALRLGLQLLEQRHELGAETKQAIERNVQLADATLQEIRRAVQQLAPPILREAGLATALVRLAGDVSEQIQLPIEVEISPDLPQLSGAYETALYRIAQEALTNAARHAQPTQVKLTLRLHNGAVELTCTDDGCGFLPHTIEGLHTGLAGMDERALLLGGQLTLESALGRGTRICAALPLPTEPT